MNKSDLIVRASSRTRETESKAGHPFNPDAEMYGHALSRVAGLARVGLWEVRLPPGKQSFVYHRHHLEEEFMYVLSGHGTVRIDGEEHEIGAGDFVGFPTGVAHGVKNSGSEDLVYLSGGENRDVEIADYPDHKRRMVRAGGKIAVYPMETVSPFPGVDLL